MTDETKYVANPNLSLRIGGSKQVQPVSDIRDAQKFWEAYRETRRLKETTSHSAIITDTKTGEQVATISFDETLLDLDGKEIRLKSPALFKGAIVKLAYPEPSEESFRYMLLEMIPHTFLREGAWRFKQSTPG